MKIWISDNPNGFAIILFFGMVLAYLGYQEIHKSNLSQSYIPRKAEINEMYHSGVEKNSQFYYTGTFIDTNTTFKGSRIDYGGVNTPEDFERVVQKYKIGEVYDVFVPESGSFDVILRKSKVSSIYKYMRNVGVFIE